MASHSAGGGRGNGKDQILEVSTLLLKDFVHDGVQRYGDSHTVVTREQLGGVELPDQSQMKLALFVRKIGDELDGNVQFQRMINDPSLKLTKETFVNIAVNIFSDGKFNWGRVVALFYFACKLVIRAIKEQVPDFIRTIINWTIDYLREHVINWIMEQGGWEGIRSYFGTPTWQMLAVFLAGVLTAVLVTRKM